MNPFVWHHLDVDFQTSLNPFVKSNAARGSHSQERRRACRVSVARRRFARASAHAVAHDLWRQDGGRIQRNCFAFACRAHRFATVDRTRFGRDGDGTDCQRCPKRCACAGQKRRHISSAAIRRGSVGSNAHGGRSRVATLAVPGVCARSGRSGIARRDAANEGGACHVREGLVSAARFGRGCDSEVQGRASASRIFQSRQFLALAITPCARANAQLQRDADASHFPSSLAAAPAAAHSHSSTHQFASLVRSAASFSCAPIWRSSSKKS